MATWLALQKWFVLLTIPVLLTLLVLNIVPAALAFFALATLYLLLDIVNTSEFLQGFTNPALVTLIILLLCSLAVERSLLIQYLSRKIISTNEPRSLLRLMGITSFLSAFMNNTAVVASFLGTISRQKNIPPSRLLIPLSYASILGGIITLIGTSTNLVVNSFLVRADLPPLQMFTFTTVGVPIAFSCMILLYFLRHRLPSTTPHTITEDGEAYFLTAEVGKDCKHIGKSINQSGLGSLEGLYLIEIVRDGRLISPVSHREPLRADDQLVFTGTIENVQLLQPYQHLTLLGGSASDLLRSNLVEVIISNESELLYKTLEAVDFNSRFHAGVVGIRRGNKRLRGQLNRIPLRIGDALLLATDDTFFHQRANDRNFHILDKTNQASLITLSKPKSQLVTFSFIAVILAAALNILSLFKGLFILLGLFLYTGCLDISDLRRRFPFDLFLIIGSALIVSAALEKTGGARMLGEYFIALSLNDNPYLSLIIIYLITYCLTEIITNNAAAALCVPLAIQTANALGVSYVPYVMTVAFGASACFIMPFGYQTHLMVYTPASYTMRDFFRIGWPIALCYGVLVCLLVPMIFPF